MDIAKFRKKVTETVVEPMTSFMKDCGDDCGYTKKDIKKCEHLIVKYLDTLAGITDPTDEQIMEQVKLLVLALNDLNEATDYSMIETDERESIWEIIQTSAIECGLQDYSDDITEEWRDW